MMYYIFMNTIMNKNERIIYYITTVDDNAPVLSDPALYDRIYKTSMFEQQEWHDAYGKDGFGSEKTDPLLFETKATQAAENAIMARGGVDGIGKTARWVAVNDDNIHATQTRVEARDNFIKWVT